MTIKTLKEIESENQERKREEFAKGIKNQVEKVFSKVRRKIKLFAIMVKFVGILVLIVLILGCAWLIKLLVTKLFF